MAKLNVGDLFPNFTVDTVYGTEIVSATTIEKLTDGKPTFFWFQRYIGCPPCRLDVQLLTEAYPEFEKKGCNIIVVMQSKPEIILRDMGGQALPYHLICDPAEALYKELEIGSFDPQNRAPMSEEEQAKMNFKFTEMKQRGYSHGDYEGNEQQLPAFFAVDKEMKVTQAHYAKSIADMPLADEVLKTL